ncbi:MAG: SpoIIE family protein phosphatase [Bacteroidia bacterium]|nr:SpoIIE family protein phosphatase [Bacteroidia bacterium]
MEITTIADEIRNTNDLEGYLNRTLEKIRANERHLVEERFFDLSLDLLCISDMNGYFTKVSKSFTTLLGYTEEELLLRPFKDFVVEDDKNNTDTAYDELKEGANLNDFENRYRCADGSIKWLAWRSVPVPGEELIFGIARDVTEHKESEARKKIYTEQLEYLIKQKNESLRYALSLQNALIQGNQLIGKVFPESFILHLPKEIVSGDFCWAEQVNDTLYVAAADCTGHGVPGALMTMVCSSLLSRAVKEFELTSPGKILDKARELLLNHFGMTEQSVNDGMDISLCAINTKTLALEWSGANNNLLYFHKKTIHEVQADKQPVGQFDNYAPFATHTLQLAKGDIIYLYSDGYADQFGGDKGKKLMYKRFIETIGKTTNLSMFGQQNRLAKAFEQWKGNQEQVDDVLIIGIRV